MNKSKRKGTAAETAVVTFLRERGALHVERRALAGSTDKGDIAGVIGTVIEVKDCARDELPTWLAEAAVEKSNAGASLGVVWHKIRGRSSPGAWAVSMTGDQFVQLLKETGRLVCPEGEIIAW